MPKSTLELPENQVTPEPSLEKRTRHRFTADYKLRILAAADRCQHGHLGALLRTIQRHRITINNTQPVSGISSINHEQAAIFSPHRLSKNPQVASH